MHEENMLSPHRENPHMHGENMLTPHRENPLMHGDNMLTPHRETSVQARDRKAGVLAVRHQFYELYHQATP